MAALVISGATLSCSFGVAPGTLNVPPVSRVTAGAPVATIMDNKPLVNVSPFGMCTSPANPGVVAALGSPVPCVPVIPAPWSPGSPTVLIAGTCALNNASTCQCAWGGIIQVTAAGQVATTVS